MRNRDTDLKNIATLARLCDAVCKDKLTHQPVLSSISGSLLLRQLDRMNIFSIPGMLLISVVALITVANATAVGGFKAYCWPTGGMMHPLVFKECLNVINNAIIPPGSDPNLPIKFSQDIKLRPDFLLPKQWPGKIGSCMVYISFMENVSGYDMTTLNDIRNAAKAIATECVIRPPHLGGVMDPVGWHSKMAVMVGRFNEPLLDLNKSLSSQ
ncbi:MAG: hypothetical protein Q9220_000691 [cf. Caloplaca sp. 1 TL-2023]